MKPRDLTGACSQTRQDEMIRDIKKTPLHNALGYKYCNSISKMWYGVVMVGRQAADQMLAGLHSNQVGVLQDTVLKKKHFTFFFTYWTGYCLSCQFH